MGLKRIVIGVTGATGAPVAVKVLQMLRELDVEVHLVVSTWAKTTLAAETDVSFDTLLTLADQVHDHKNLAASISSGSFRHDGMAVVPCSMKTLAGIRSGMADNLVTRAADVTIKERRKLVLAVRETPLSSIHLENMLFLSNQGVVIFPLVPAYYHRPLSVDDINTQMAGRILDQLGLEHPLTRRWRDPLANH